MASGGVYAETLELPTVPDDIVSGGTFIKWDDVRELKYFYFIYGAVIEYNFELSPLSQRPNLYLEQGQLSPLDVTCRSFLSESKR